MSSGIGLSDVEVSLKKRLLAELLIVTVLTSIFLVVFPERPMYVDVLLGIVAVALVAANARFTRDVVWDQFPVDTDRRICSRRSYLWVSVVSGFAVLAVLVAGAVLGYSDNGWSGVWQRLANWHIVAACCLYLPWALLQQFLFQFYLLGRLLSLVPSSVAVIATGLAYSLVHLPDVGVTAATAPAGVFWTALYCKYRVLMPLALSHAVLASTFYYWVYGSDLFMTWTRAVQ